MSPDQLRRAAICGWEHDRDGGLADVCTLELTSRDPTTSERLFSIGNNVENLLKREYKLLTLRYFAAVGAPRHGFLFTTLPQRPAILADARGLPIVHSTPFHFAYQAPTDPPCVTELSNKFTLDASFKWLKGSPLDTRRVDVATFPYAAARYLALDLTALLDKLHAEGAIRWMREDSPKAAQYVPAPMTVGDLARQDLTESESMRWNTDHSYLET